MRERRDDITQLLSEWHDGDRGAFDLLIPLVYDDLQRIAHRHLSRERPDHTLDTGALVHESYLNLVRGSGAEWRDRAHFFAVASRAMRHVLVDYARRRNAMKRGGAGRVEVTIDDLQTPVHGYADELIAIDEILTQLGERDPRLVQIVECRYFGRMPVSETAEALGVSCRTVERDWARARAYLYRALTSETGQQTLELDA